MRTFVTEQQASFFTQNGYIELEGLNFNSKEVFSAARSLPLPSSDYTAGRDLWRKNKTLQTLLLQQLTPTVLRLSGKSIRLACDQWISHNNLLTEACSLKDLFSVQGLVLGAIFSSVEIELPTRRQAALGIVPLPKTCESILFVKPNIILDWPLLIKAAIKTPIDIYIAAYALPNTAVYVYNPQDPATHSLKQLGYEFGDPLRDPHHPLIQMRRV